MNWCARRTTARVRPPCTRRCIGTMISNDPANLRWGTQADNNADARRNGKAFHLPPMRGEGHASIRISRAVVDAIRARAAAGEPVKRIAREVGVSATHAARIAKGRARP